MTNAFDSIAETFLADMHARFIQLRATADSALRQTNDEDFFRPLGAVEDNSIAIIVKHMAGNLRSRFTDFLTSDGEKPDRDRDGEFELRGGDSRDAIMEAWEAGWETLFNALGTLAAHDLTRTVFIRGEPHPVIGAIGRQLSHQAYHVGQIVLLAKHYAASDWHTLSVPRGRSPAFTAELQARHLPDGPTT